MQIFAGLGNPGPKYAANRHNIGFMALDRIAEDHGFGPWKARFQGEVAEGRLGTEKVILQVIPKRTALSGTGSTTLAPPGFDVFTVGTSSTNEGRIALPRVSSSTLATTVLLTGGQTAVLGGLKTKNETETETKLPFLGDIPILGHLFKNTTRQETTSTLLVFITPTIIRTTDDIEQTMSDVLREKTRDHRSTLASEREAIFGGDQ